MESKHVSQSKKDVKTSRSKTISELSSRMADIELKLDHVIERIKDSLHRQSIRDRNDDKEESK